jgi:hypothetical protein
MNANIMAEWLKAFYAHISDHDILLIMDNLSAHIAAIQITPPPNNVGIM